MIEMKWFIVIIIFCINYNSKNSRCPKEQQIQCVECSKVKLNAREKAFGAGEKLEVFETHFRIK
jgi:hypothetical protein